MQVRMVDLKKIVSAFTFRISVRSPQTGREEEFQAIVDTGSHFTTIPAVAWERLSLEVVDEVEMEMELELANGQIVPTPIGYAEVGVDGRTVLTLCAKGEAGSPPLLGATTMDLLLIMPDPGNERFLRARGLRA